MGDICLQWIDFRDVSEFQVKCAELAGAIFSAVGPGSGPERSVAIHQVNRASRQLVIQWSDTQCRESAWSGRVIVW